MKRFSVIALVLLLGACSSERFNVGRIGPGALVGGAVGALAGGMVGSEIGAGLGQSLAMATGIVFGAGGGYALGERLYPSDQVAYDKTASRALNASEDGQPLAWSNDETGNSGIFRPVRTFKTADGWLCRDYRTTTALQERIRQGTGTACLQADGNWRVLLENDG